jgi:hypothetical protein
MQTACSPDVLIRSSVLLEIQKIKRRTCVCFVDDSRDYASKVALKSLAEVRDTKRVRWLTVWR